MEGAVGIIPSQSPFGWHERCVPKKRSLLEKRHEAGMNKPRSSRARGYQISRGFQVCVSCFHESILVRAHRCVDCDREVCTLCAVRIEDRENLCPECANERQSVSQRVDASSANKEEEKRDRTRHLAGKAGRPKA